MKKNVLLALAWCCFSILCSVQTMAQSYTSATSPEYEASFIPDKPEVGSLGTFGFNPITKYNGTANINIPLHQLSLDGLTIPIRAIYNTGGIRVDQEATCIGLGWNLTAGASIRNEINGYDDTKKSVGINSGQPMGYLYTREYLTRNHPTYELEITQEDTQELVSANQSGGPRDVEPDTFIVDLFGREIKFVLKKLESGETVSEAIMVGNPNIKASFDTVDLSFTVIDENGFHYFFDKVELSTPNVHYYSGGGYPPGFTYDDHIRIAHTRELSIHDIFQDRISWQITKVTSPYGNEINFNYIQTLGLTFPNVSEEVSITCNNYLDIDNGNPLPEITSAGNSPEYTARMYVTESWTLRSIIGDFGMVEFDLEERLDLFNDDTYEDFCDGSLFYERPPSTFESPKRVEAILVKNIHGNTVKTINFQHSYFNSQYLNQADNQEYLRLKLDGVSINDQNYNFDYINSNALPSKISRDQDFWGFYNGAENEGLMPRFNRFVNTAASLNYNFEYFWNYNRGNTRKSDFNFAKNGSLDKVTYPTGGSTTYEYEGNTATVATPEEYTPNITTDGTFRHSGITNSSAYEWNYQYLKMANDPNYSFVDYSNTEECSVSLTNYGRNGEFTVDDTDVCGETNRNIRIYTTISCATGCQYDVEPTGPATWLRNVTTGAVTNIFSFDGHSPNNGQGWSVNLQYEAMLSPGTYRLETNPSWVNPSPEQAIFTNNSTLTFYKGNSNDAGTSFTSDFEEFQVGGLRVKSITERTSANIIAGKRLFHYDETKSNGSIASSGVLMDELVFHSKNKGYWEYTPEGYYDNTINIHSRNVLRGKNAASGSHVGYTTVAERTVDPNNSEMDLGKTVCTYTNIPNDYKERFIGNTPATLGIDADDPADDGPTVFYANVYTLNMAPKSYAYKNGQLLKQEQFSNAGQLVAQTDYEYYEHQRGSYISDAYPHISYQFFIVPNCPNDLCGYEAHIPHFEPIRMSDITTQYFSSLKEVTNTTALEGGDLVTSTEYVYDSFRHFWPTSVINTLSDNEVLVEKNTYPLDLEDEPYMSSLIDLNRVGVPVTTDSYIGTVTNPEHILLQKQIVNYSNTHNPMGIIMPNEIEVQKGGDVLEVRSVYERYDHQGRILQVKQANGQSTSYIWSYNGMYPVAKVENATYAQIEALPFFGNGFILEGDLTINQENTLRNLPNVMVSTYKINPLVGVTSMTDPRGYTMHYEYDAENRLKWVKDATGNILSENEYNYRTN